MTAGAVLDGPAVVAGLYEAINDEYRARASYLAAIDAFGPRPPFTTILQSEGRHIAALLPLFSRYGLPVPPDVWAGRVSIPGTATEMCRAGVAAEIANYRMYDRLLSLTNDPAVRRVFESLRRASRDHHLPAFERCAGSAVAPVGASPARVGMGALPALALGLVAGVALVWTMRRP